MAYSSRPYGWLAMLKKPSFAICQERRKAADAGGPKKSGNTEETPEMSERWEDLSFRILIILSSDQFGVPAARYYSV